MGTGQPLLFAADLRHQVKPREQHTYPFINNKNTNDQAMSVTDAFYTFVTLVIVLLGAAIAFFNTACIRAIVKHNLCYRDYKFVLMINLAVTDIILGLMLVVLHPLDHWVLSGSFSSTPFCLFEVITSEILYSATMLSIIAIVLERYLKVVYPLKYHGFVTSRTMLVGIATIWILSFLHSLLALIGINLEVIEQTQCSFLHVASRGFLMYSVIFQFVIPTTTVLVLHVKIIKIALAHGRQIGVQQGEIVQQAVHQHQWKTILTVIIVTATLIACWLPYQIIALIKIFDPRVMAESWTLYAAEVSYVVYYINSLLSPVIRSRRYPEIRNDVDVRCCLTCSKDHKTCSSNEQQDSSG